MPTAKSSSLFDRPIVEVHLCGTPVYDKPGKFGVGEHMLTCDGYFELTHKGAIELAVQLIKSTFTIGGSRK